MGSIRDRLPAANSFVVRTTLLITAMIACAALGLWIHERYVVASADWTARDKAFNELTAVAEYGRLKLMESPSQNHLEQVLADFDNTIKTGRHDCFVVTNQQLQPVAINRVDPIIANAIPAEFDWFAEDTVGSSYETGQLRTSIGPMLGMRWKTTNGWGFVLRPVAVIVADGDAIKQSLPAAAGIALLWIGALQAVILYLFFNKLNTDNRRSTDKSNHKALLQAEELVRTQDAIIFGLAKLADSRDPETGMHLERISMYATQLATAMSRKAKYSSRITPSFVRLIGISSALHDIGKVGVEDAILRKPGPLTAGERTRMQEHTVVGAECLRQIEQRLGPSNFLQMAREIGLNHHERWDGGGYPNGISAEKIPLSARIVAIADVYDALANRRVYKDACSHEECVRMITEGAGSHFDPEIVDEFLEINRQFESIHRRFGERLKEESKPIVSPQALECLEAISQTPAAPQRQVAVSDEA